MMTGALGLGLDTYQIDCFASLESSMIQVVRPRVCQDGPHMGKDRWVNPSEPTLTRSKPRAVLGIKLAFARQEKLILRFIAGIARAMILFSLEMMEN